MIHRLLPREMIMDVRTVRVLGCQPLGRPDRRVAIRFDTLELGPIAFEVDQRTIDWIRKALTDIEFMLDRPGGNA
jgi:hypothetical protein